LLRKPKIWLKSDKNIEHPT